MPWLSALVCRDLPDLARDFPAAGLVPILPMLVACNLIVRNWAQAAHAGSENRHRTPAPAEGHLGATRLGDVHDDNAV